MHWAVSGCGAAADCEAGTARLREGMIEHGDMAGSDARAEQLA